MLTLMNSTLDVNIARQFDELTTFFWGTFYSAMLNFILLLTNKDKLLRKIWGIPLIYLPAAICIALYYFAPIIHVKYVHTPLGWANIKISNGFFYDIFFVFGTDVMITVAKSIDAPIKL